MRRELRRVVYRGDAKRNRLRDRILNELDLCAQEALLIEYKKLAQYGPEPDEIEEVLSLRYELFRRELWGVGLIISAVHDTTTGQITILDASESALVPNLYQEACQALNLANVTREQRPKQ